MEFDWMRALKGALTTIIGAFSAFWGWMGWLVVAWVVLMALDYATGTAAALKGGSWSSRAAREGIWHKTGEVVVVLVAALGDTVLATVVEQLPLHRAQIFLPQLLDVDQSPLAPTKGEVLEAGEREGSGVIHPSRWQVTPAGK